MSFSSSSFFDFNILPFITEDRTEANRREALQALRLERRTGRTNHPRAIAADLLTEAGKMRRDVFYQITDCYGDLYAGKWTLPVVRASIELAATYRME